MPSELTASINKIVPIIWGQMDYKIHIVQPLEQNANASSLLVHHIYAANSILHCNYEVI